MAIGHPQRQSETERFPQSVPAAFRRARKDGVQPRRAQSKVVWWSIDGHGRRKTIARGNPVGKKNLRRREGAAGVLKFIVYANRNYRTAAGRKNHALSHSHKSPH